MANRSLGDAVLRTVLDKSGLTTGLNSAKADTNRTLDQIDRRWEQTGRNITRIGTGLTIGLTLPLAAIGGASLKAASDAEETASKFATVFQDVGDDAERAARRMADSYGLSSRASKQLLGDTGDLLTGFGFTGAAALDLSTEVNELAVDLASFTNYSGGAEGASAALTKALLGETEAAKGLGIAIRADLVTAKIEEMRAAGELAGATDAQAKAYATLAIAQEQSKNAMGDFARTSDSFANQTRILRANLDDVAVSLGEGILPIATPVISGLADMAEGFSNMSEETRTFILVTGFAAAATGPLLIGLGRFVTVAPKVVAGLRAIRTAALFMGPGGLIAGGIGLVLGLGAAFLSTRDDADEVATAIDAAQDSVGNASDKDSLTGALKILSQEVDGPVAAALDRLIEKVDSSKTSFEDAKAAADAFFNSELERDAKRLEAAIVERDRLREIRNAQAPGGDVAGRQAELQTRADEILDAAPGGIVPPEQMQELEELRAEMQQLELGAAGVGSAIFGPNEQQRLHELNAEILTLRDNLGILGRTGVLNRTDRGSGLESDEPPPPGNRDGAPGPLGSLRRLEEDLADERERFELATTDVVREQSAERIRVLQAEIDEMRAILRSAEPFSLLRTPEQILARQEPLNQQRLAAQQGGGPGQTAPIPVTFDISAADFVAGRIVAQSQIAGSTALQGQLQTQGGPVRQSQEDIDAFNERVAESAERQATAAGALTDFERETRDAVGGMVAFNQRLAEIESIRVVVDRIRTQAEIAASPGFQGRLQTQGGPGAPQAAEDLEAFNAEVRAAAQRQAEDAGALTEHERAVRAASQALYDHVRATDAVLGALVGQSRIDGYGAMGQGRDLNFPRTLTPDEEAFGLGAGNLSADLTRRAERGDGGLEDAKRVQEDAAENFKKTVISAGAGFATDLASAIESGDVGGAVESLVGAGGSIVSSLAGMWGPLVSAGFSIFGGLLGGLFGGGQGREDVERVERARVRGAPALEFHVTVNQDYQVTGGFTSPEARQFINQAARATVDEIFARTRVLERLQVQEARA